MTVEYTATISIAWPKTYVLDTFPISTFSSGTAESSAFDDEIDLLMELRNIEQSQGLVFSRPSDYRSGFFCNCDKNNLLISVVVLSVTVSKSKSEYSVILRKAGVDRANLSSRVKLPPFFGEEIVDFISIIADKATFVPATTQGHSNAHIKSTEELILRRDQILESRVRR
jgi:hypothetical protein